MLLIKIMRNKKKIIVTSFTILACAIVLFSKAIFSFGTITTLNYYCKKNLNKTFNYQKLVYEKGKIVLKNVHFKGSNDDEFKIHFQEMDIKWDLHFAKKFFDIDLTCKNSHIDLYENIYKKRYFKNVRNSSFVDFSLTIQNGSVDLIKKDFSKRINFDFYRNKDSLSKLSFGFDNTLNKEIMLVFNHELNEKIINCELNKVPLDSLKELFSYFSFTDLNRFSNVSGQINGFATFNIKNNDFDKFLVKLDFNDFAFFDLSSKLNFFMKNLKLEADYLPQNNSSCFLLDLLPIKIAKDTRIKTSVEGLDVKSQKKWNLANIDGFFSYNPGVGPKLSMKGTALNENSHPFNLEGRGYINSSFSNWLDLSLFLDEETPNISINAKEIKKDNYQIDLKLAKINPLIFEATQNLFGNIFTSLNSWSVVNGKCDLKASAKYNKSGFKKLVIEDFLAEELEFSYNEKEYQAFFDKLSISGSFDINNYSFSDLFSLNVNLVSSSFFYKDQMLKNLKTDIKIVKGLFQPSLITCLFNNFETEVEIKGPAKKFNLLAKLKGNLKEHEDKFSSIISCKKNEKNFTFSGNIQISDGQEALFGFDLSNVKHLLSYELESYLSSIEMGWLRAEKVLLKKWPKVFNLDLDIDGISNIAAFFRKDKINMQIKGEHISYKNPNISVEINKIGDLNSFVFENDNFIELTYENGNFSGKSPLFDGSFFIPKFDLSFQVNKANIALIDNDFKITVFDSNSENLKLCGNVFFSMPQKNYSLLDIQVENFEGSFNDFQKFGRHFDFNGNFDFEGMVNGGFNIFTKFYDQNSDVQWQIETLVNKLIIPINEKSKIEDLQAKINYNSIDNEINFEDISAILALKEKSYQISCPLLKYGENIWDFDLRVSNSIWDVLRLQGEIKEQDNKLIFSFNEKGSSYFNEKLNISDLIIDEAFNLEKINLQMHSKSSRFFMQMQFLIDFGLFPINNLSLQNLINMPSKGQFITKIKMDENQPFNCHVFSKDFTINNKSFEKFELLVKKDKNSWNIEKVLLDDLESKFLVEMDEKKWKVYDFEINQRDCISCLLEGTYFEDEAKFNAKLIDLKIDLKKFKNLLSDFISFPKTSIEGYLKGNGAISIDLPSQNKDWSFNSDWDIQPDHLIIDSMRLGNRGPLNINLSTQSGLIVQGIDLNFYSKIHDLSYLKCQIGQIAYNFEKNKWSSKETYLYFPKDLISELITKEKFQKFSELIQMMKFDEDIELTFDLESLNDFSMFTVVASKGSFLVNNHEHQLQDIFVSYDSKTVNLDFNYLLQEKYYKVKNVLDIEDNLICKTYLFDENSKLTNIPLLIEWEFDKNEGFNFNEIQGSFSGIDLSFQTDVRKQLKNHLFGHLKFDLKEALELFPKEIKDIFAPLKIGKGYEIRGALKIDPKDKQWIDFKGIFSGKQFELFGYQFKTLLSQIEATSDSVMIKNFKISDSSGIVSINDIEMKKLNDEWSLSIPNLKVRDLRPSLFKDLEGKQCEIEPLLIRELNIYNFSGKLNDRNSFTGKGFLYFINSFKRGHSIFDFPSDVLSRIVGLDLELLTPVKGRIDYRVKNGKFYLTQMKHSYSEGKRSKFFLSDKGQRPFIDFDGNIHINIAMKQYVLFKFTESFIISIRGKLNSPDLNLKKKRSFLIP